MSRGCCVALPRCAMCLSAVCDCGISLSYSLTILEGSTSSEVFAKHLNALHAARKIFIQTEVKEKIRRALRNKIRASDQIFENGDRFFFISVKVKSVELDQER